MFLSSSAYTSDQTEPSPNDSRRRKFITFGTSTGALAQGSTLGQSASDFDTSTGVYTVPKAGKYYVGALFRDTYTSNFSTGYSNRGFIYITDSSNTEKLYAWVAESSWTAEGSGTGFVLPNLAQGDKITWLTSTGGTTPPFGECVAQVYFIGN
tara:strand:+ start:106 stop:564 length:459 start_codon:yes stop_codon:yes gene_type:complete